MDLTIKYNLARENWDSFVAAESADGGFLQSWNWGEFQLRLRRKIFRLAIAIDGRVVACALAVKQEMPLGFSYLYLPRGPVIARGITLAPVFDLLKKTLVKVARQEQSIFIRLDPPWIDAKELAAAGFRSSGSVQPQSTLIMDLSPSEDELLSQMKAKTRYNIKLAQKHGITVAESDKNPEDFAEFWRLLQLTSERDAIKSHNKDYYRSMLECGEVRLVFARIEGKNVAANIMVRFGQREIYLHGASDYAYRDKMAPYLLQWEMIRQAKAAGCLSYDFWGADAKRWPGVTRFKRGFAPDRPLTEYVGAYDLVCHKLLYALYNLYKKII